MGYMAQAGGTASGYAPAVPANPDPIIADFDYVHQFDPGSNPQIDKCDPAGFGE